MTDLRLALALAGAIAYSNTDSTRGSLLSRSIPADAVLSDWRFLTEFIDNPAQLQYRIWTGDRPATVCEVIRAWECSSDFRTDWTDTLAAAPLSTSLVERLINSPVEV